MDSLSAADVKPGNMDFSQQDFVRAHWKFIRRYMEEGPQSVSGLVQFCMPVSERRESFMVGVERVFANIAGANFILYWRLFPVCLTISLCRFIAIQTSKIPQWPQDIEAISAIEDGDPYAIEGDATGERIAVFPESARVAGVAFNVSQEVQGERGARPIAKSPRMRNHTVRR